MPPKPCTHIGIIGHSRHGKSTLTTALKIVSDAIYGDGCVKALDEMPVEWTDGIQVVGSEVEYQSLSRRYVHVDFASLCDLLKALVVSARAIDGILVVVDARSGVELGTGEQLALARAAGIEHAVAFINKADVAGPVLVEATKLELVELLSAKGYPQTPVVVGSAKEALDAAQHGVLRHPAVKAIRRLVQALDDHVVTSSADHVHDEGGPSSIIRSSRSPVVAA